MPSARFKPRRNFTAPAVSPRKRAKPSGRFTDFSFVPGSTPGRMPAVLTPQLATLVKTPPTGAGWVHEIKYDGYRMLLRIEGGEARIVSRNGKEWTDQFQSIADAAGALPVDEAWLDGELCVVDEKGRSSFQALQNVLSEAPGTLAFFAFDLLYADGVDLRGCRLIDRKQALQRLLQGASRVIRYSDHFDVPATEFHQSVCKLGLEGMVSKRADGGFQSGRSSAWLKVKCLLRQEFVVGGWSDPEGSRHGFGALLLGVYEPDGRLTFVGKVGTGFNDRSLAMLSKRLAAIPAPSPSFHNPPRGAEARRSHWVRPELVVEVAFTEWTNEGTLRHPSFQGLREDKPAKEVKRELPAS